MTDPIHVIVSRLYRRRYLTLAEHVGAMIEDVSVQIVEDKGLLRVKFTYYFSGKNAEKAWEIVMHNLQEWHRSSCEDSSCVCRES